MFILEQVVAGLAAGASYGLLGLAIVIVMKSTDVPNFAAAEIGLIGAYICWTLTASAGGPRWGFLPSVLAGLTASALVGVLVQILVMRPFAGLSSVPLAIVASICVGIVGVTTVWTPTAFAAMGNLALPLAALISLGVAALIFVVIRYGIPASLRADHFALLLVTIGVVFVLSAIIHSLWGSEPRALPTPWAGGSIRVFRFSVGYGQLITIAGGFAVAIGLGAFFRTSYGVQMRAIAEDSSTARLLGINSGRISMMAWAIGGMIAALALILKTSETLLEPGAGATLILSGFIAATLGGFTSLRGAFFGGVIVGIGEALAGSLIDSRLQPTIALLVVVVTLLLLPGGLTSEKKRRQI
jgi:branched-chain amino acid transport system permease protein